MLTQLRFPIVAQSVTIRIQQSGTRVLVQGIGSKINLCAIRCSIAIAVRHVRIRSKLGFPFVAQTVTICV